jgi:hypothetical protein
VAYYAAYIFCDLEELSLLIIAIAPTPIETTIIGPSPLSAVTSDSRNLYRYEVCSMIHDNGLLA